MSINFFKYIIIGILNTLIHWGVFYLVFNLLSNQGLCNFLGFTCATFFSYFMNSKYNFKKNMEMKGFICFYIIIASIMIGVGIMADFLSFPKIMTLVISSLFCLLLGYILSKKLVFNRE